MIAGHKLHEKYKKEWEFYNSYPFKKCTKSCYRQRFQKWMELKDAVKPISARVKAKRVTELGRDCISCEIFKPYSCFAKEKNWYNGYSGKCLDCRNLYKKEARKNKEINEIEKQYKRDQRSTDIWKIRQKLDNIYYQDPQVLRNRSIIKSFRKISREEAVKSKCEFLHNCWYSTELLQKVYGENIEHNKRIVWTRY